MYLYFLFLGPPLLFAIWAQFKVKSAFKKHSKMPCVSGVSGAEAAANMLRAQGLQVVASSEQALAQKNAVAISATRGFLSDHYDPSAKELRLSRKVYDGHTLSAVGVACHEAGHALQHAQGYAPLQLRTFMVPLASFGSWAAFPIIFIGFILHMMPLVFLGVIGFSILVLFQIITLPVEFDASSRAKEVLYQSSMIRGHSETDAVAEVLNAAALTYVAAVVSSIATLLYYIMILTGGND